MCSSKGSSATKALSHKDYNMNFIFLVCALVAKFFL